MVGHPTGDHAWKHHAERLHGCEDAENGGTALALREIDEVEHIGCETETVAKLLNENTEVYY